MPIKNYTTKVSAVQSVAEIISMLAAHGATKIQQDFDGGEPTRILFQINTPNGMRGFILPANVEMVHSVLLQQKVKVDDAQAKRVAWRIVRDWVAAQMAILETEMVTVDEIFLPYMADNTGRTMYQLYQSQLLQLPECDYHGD